MTAPLPLASLRVSLHVSFGAIPRPWHRGLARQAKTR